MSTENYAIDDEIYAEIGKSKWKECLGHFEPEGRRISERICGIK